MPSREQPAFTIPIETLHFTKRSNSPHESPVLSGDQLPNPDLSLLHQYSTKKSHARRQPPGHIPRPRNAFILFRSSLVHQNKVPKGAESDHCAISRHAGDLWRHLTKEQKAPWAELADVEKKLHADLYPNYRYNPTSAASSGRSVPPTKKFTFKHHRDHSQKRGEHDFPPQALPPFPSFPPRRSSSCPPPGSEPVKQIAAIPSFTSPPTVTRDDLTRRPSRTTMYHAATSEPMGDNSVYTFPYQYTDVPPLTTGPYSMTLPRDVPGWDYPPPAPIAFNQSDADVYYRFLQFKLLHDCNSQASVSHIFDNVNPFSGETAAGSESLPAAQYFFSPLDPGGRRSDDQNNTGTSNEEYFGAGGSGQMDLLFPGLFADEDTALQLSSPFHFQLEYPPSGTTPTAVEGEFSI